MNHIELDPEDTRIGSSAESMERRALSLIAHVFNDAYTHVNRQPVYGLPRVCERSTQPLPFGCWAETWRSPYALYSAERWCNACIAYAALNGTLPRPTMTIDATAHRAMEVS